MSAFDTVALPGRIPTVGNIPGKQVESLIRSRADEYPADGAIGMVNGEKGSFKVKKVKVEIFDLSDQSQREDYEKLWADLLVKVSKMEAVVETSKDLVHRPDGTSYWMKYVEYVEFGDINEKDRSDKK